MPPRGSTYRPELIDVESRALSRESNLREIALSIGARDIFHET